MNEKEKEEVKAEEEKRDERKIEEGMKNNGEEKGEKEEEKYRIYKEEKLGLLGGERRDWEEEGSEEGREKGRGEEGGDIISGSQLAVADETKIRYEPEESLEFSEIMRSEYDIFPGGHSVYERILSIEENLKEKGKKCLIIDDSKFTRMNIINVLTKHGLFDADDIIEAEDGIEGISKFAKFMAVLDVVICDVQMRNMDGIKFIKAVNNMKKEFKEKGDMKMYFLISIIPIITITGTAQGIKLEALEIGAKDFVFKPSREITQEDFEKELIARVKIHITLKRTFENLLKTTDALYQASIIDPLTGAYNRRHMNEILKMEYSRALRKGAPLSVVIFDIDEFKKINDTYGHTIGDKVLCDFVQRIKMMKREYDQVFRFGGDEFLVVMPETRLDGVRSFYERLKKTLEEKPLKYENIIVSFTVSAGATFFPSNKTRTVEELIKNADDALYEAKKSGKNRLCVIA